jgi:hypothetical protein
VRVYCKPLSFADGILLSLLLNWSLCRYKCALLAGDGLNHAKWFRCAQIIIINDQIEQIIKYAFKLNGKGNKMKRAQPAPSVYLGMKSVGNDRKYALSFPTVFFS